MQQGDCAFAVNMMDNLEELKNVDYYDYSTWLLMMSQWLAMISPQTLLMVWGEWCACRGKIIVLGYVYKTLSKIMEPIYGIYCPMNIKTCTDIDKFKSLLKSWEGPKCQSTMCNALS